MNQKNNPPVPQRRMETTRFVFISDTFNYHPNLPKGDVLCHARGLSASGSIAELRATLNWIDEADFEVKIIIGGSTDVTLDDKYYQGNRRKSDQEIDDSAECIHLVSTYPSIKYLNHQATTVHLRKSDGPKTIFNIFGSPRMPAYSEGPFGYDRNDGTTIERIWSTIPLDVDVVLSHTPAYNHRDASTRWQAAGCEGLRKALWQVRPQLAICGRIPEARGVEKVRWKLDLPLSPFLEEHTTQWTDPGANRMAMSLVDLTEASGNPLLNDGAPGPRLPENNVSFSSAKQERPAVPSRIFEDFDEAPPSEVMTTVSSSIDMTACTIVPQDAWNPKNTVYPPEPVSYHQYVLSRLRHRNAGRFGRQETLIMNAGMVVSNDLNLLSFSQPIVVDIDLPVGDEFAYIDDAGHP